VALKNLIYATFPVAVHIPGRWYERNKKSLQLLHCLHSAPQARIRPVDGLSVVTWNSSPDRSLLEMQCEREGLELSVLGRGIEQWENGLKGSLLVEFAKGVQTEFVLAMDAFDVVIQGDLSRCVEELKRQECEVLFGAEIGSFPSDESFESFEEARYVPPWQHLNSGLMVARTSFLADLSLVGGWGKCDQATWRKMHLSLYPKIKLDDHCRCFQNLNCYRRNLDDLFSVSLR
jgi:hypothetical protein